MKSLVLVAHGSRKQASNESVIELSKVISERLEGDFPIISVGFLELAEPFIPESIENCIRQGANEVYVMPYFLSAGRHVQVDVPAEIEKARKSYPEASITLLTHIGGVPQMADFLCDTVLANVKE